MIKIRQKYEVQTFKIKNNGQVRGNSKCNKTKRDSFSCIGHIRKL